MIVVINAGGSGTRLWPLSTPEFPKHLLTLVGEESLLQSAYRRAKKISKDVYVVTEVSHAHLVKQQLPDLPDDACIIEPGRRGTAGCMLAGLHHVQSRHAHDEPIAFLHADHVIRDIDGFVHSFKIAGDAAKQNGHITLLGIEPTYAAIAFGYIHKDATVSDEPLVYKVKGFTEKPPLETAKKYLQSGEYLWNCGYFVGSVDSFARDFAEFAPKWKAYYDQLLATKNEAEFSKTYLSFDNDAIDYALLEHDTNLQVVPASFDWADIGSFADLYTALQTDENGNYLQGKPAALEEVQNAYIRNDEQKPIIAIGVDNIVIVNTKNGLLVTRKDLSQRVKEGLQQIKSQN